MNVLESLMPFAILVTLLFWFIFASSALTRFADKLMQGGAYPLRVALSVLAWMFTSLMAYHFGAKNYFVLGEITSAVAFIRFYANWQLDLALFGVGLPFALTGFISSLFCPSHSVSEVLLLICGLDSATFSFNGEPYQRHSLQSA